MVLIPIKNKILPEWLALQMQLNSILLLHYYKCFCRRMYILISSISSSWADPDQSSTPLVDMGSTWYLLWHFSNTKLNDTVKNLRKRVKMKLTDVHEQKEEKICISLLHVTCVLVCNMLIFLQSFLILEKNCYINL